MVKFIPEYVVKHMNMNHVNEYREDVVKKYPLPEGYAELEYGDEGVIYNRRTLEEKEVHGWDDFNFQVWTKAKLGWDGHNPIWWVKKI